MALTASQRWWISLPFILALGVFGFILWSAYITFGYPHEGVRNYSLAGQITELDKFGEKINQLQRGDFIVSINGILISEGLPFYRGKHPGDTAVMVVDRGGQIITLTVQLTLIPRDQVLVPILVALAFWGIGVVVLAFKPGDATSNLFFLFSQLSALVLSAGLISSIGPSWVSNLFNFLVWLLGPVAVHFHLYFPQSTSWRLRRNLLIPLYTLAMLGGLPNLILGTQALLVTSWSNQIQAAKWLFLTFNLLAVIGLLVHAYRHAGSPSVRAKIRIVLLGGVLSLMPLVLLTILPEALLSQQIISFSFSLLFLGILPATYGYAIIRHRLIEIDRHVNRGATLIIVFSVLGAFYAVLYAIPRRLEVIRDIAPEALINTLLVVILAAIFPWLYQRVKRLVDTAFYGGWYDYRSAVSQITQGLEQITELTPLAQTVGNRLVKTLQLEDACIFLRNLEGDFSVIEVSPTPRPGDPTRPAFTTLPKNSLNYLLNIGAVGKSSLRKVLTEVKLSTEERQLLESEQIYLWVPVIGHGQVLGLLALGAKLGGDVFSGEDMDILRIVARQTGPLIENIHLVTRLRHYAAELEQRVAARTAELYAEKERVEAVLSSVGDGVIVTDLNASILTVNQAFEEQSGYRAGELIGQSIFTLLNGQEDENRIEEIQAALASKFNWSGELMVQRKGGRYYDVQLTIAPVREQSGDIMGYVGSQRDITQYKELERLKDQFILEVSHELRTPVTNMGLFAELLERGKPEKKGDYLAILKTEINQLMKMIEDILDLSRLEIGKYKKATFGPVDLNLLTEQVVAAHSPLAQEGGLDLVFEPEENLPSIHGEQNQLARVITNLLSNAIRYTEKGFVHVRTTQNHGMVWLEVKDSGMGIDPDDLPHLFERFYRGKKVSQSKILGSGLGLAIVKEIVELHDGKVEWESEVGLGSTFRVSFPTWK